MSTAEQAPGRGAGGFRFQQPQLEDVRSAILELGRAATRTRGITAHEEASRAQDKCLAAIEAAVTAALVEHGDPQVHRLRYALERAQNVLGNMALEHTTGWRGIFARWPIHHEPLRSDARAILPIIDAALGDEL